MKEHSTNENSLTLPVLESSWSLGKHHSLSRDYPRTEFRPCFLWWKSEFLQRSSWFWCKVIKWPPFFYPLLWKFLFSLKKKVIKIFFSSLFHSPSLHPELQPPCWKTFQLLLSHLRLFSLPCCDNTMASIPILQFFFFFNFTSSLSEHSLHEALSSSALSVWPSWNCLVSFS